jgi:flagellar biosynthesis anti-sigma factor FlgM
VKVGADYSRIIDRILNSGKQKESPRVKPEAASGAERREISRVMIALQEELKRLDAEPSPERAARLQELKEVIARGDYRVDSAALAGAMLDFDPAAE